MQPINIKRLIADLIYCSETYSMPAQYAMYDCIVDDKTQQPVAPDALLQMLTPNLDDPGLFDDECWKIASSENLYDRYIAIFGNTGKHTSSAIGHANEEQVRVYAEQIICGDMTPTVPAELLSLVDDYCGNIVVTSQQYNFCQNYINYFGSNGRHFSEVKNLMSTLPPPPPEDRYSPRKIAEALNNDPNASGYNADTLRSYGISYESLLPLIHSIPNEVLRFALNDTTRRQIFAATLPKDHKLERCVEVYFWGVPRAGKSSILASLLSHAYKEGKVNWATGATNVDGENYYSSLSQLMRSEIAWIPQPTVGSESQYMMLCNPRQQKCRFVLFDVAGEIIQLIYNRKLGHIGDTEGQDVLDSFNHYLHDSNPKFHFFVYDVSNNFMDIQGVYQSDYIDKVREYFDQTGAFPKKTTMGFAFIAAKSDLLSQDEKERKVQSEKVIRDNCASFIGMLETTALSYGILRKGESIPIIPYSIGQVYMGDVCVPNSTQPHYLLNYIMNNILGMRIE